MGECKAKANQTNLGTFRHNQTYLGIIQAYSDILRTLCYPDISKAVVYPEPWHIQNQKHIFLIEKKKKKKKRSIFKTSAYSEPRYIQNAVIFKIWGIFRSLAHIYDKALIIFMAKIILTIFIIFAKLAA